MALQHRFLKPPSPGALIPALSKNALSIPWPKVCSVLGYAVRGKILSVANVWDHGPGVLPPQCRHLIERALWWLWSL